MKPKIKVEKLLVIKYITSNSLGTGVLGARDAVASNKSSSQNALEISSQNALEISSQNALEISSQNAAEMKY